MVSYYLTTPFPDLARQRLFEAVAAALQAEPAGPATLLLGHVAVSDEAGQVPFDAVVVQPHGITLLLLVPGGGRLSIPALGYGAWQLGGRPLAGRGGFDNLFEQFGQQKADLADWLATHLPVGQANLHCIKGLVLFSEPVTFAPDAKLALQVAPANGFQLLASVAALPRCLGELATPEINFSPEELAALAVSLLPDDEQATAMPASVSARATSSPAASEAANFLGQKARKLWGWLGAADIPDEDPPYGYDPAAAAAARREEKQQLEQMRQQMQADVAAQLHLMEARESERERSIAQLRAQLAQAPAVAPEAAQLEARLAAENREKATQEASMQVSQAEAASRNQELDAKIQQLGQLIERLNTPAAPPAAPPLPAAGELASAHAVVPMPAVGNVAPAVAPPVSTPAAVAPAIAAPAAPAPPLVVPQPTVTAPVASAPMAAVPGWMGGAGARLAASVSPVWASYRASVRAAGRKLATAAAPQAARGWAWLRQGQRRRVAAGGLVALALAGWGAGHLGGSAPAPYQENGRWGFADADGKPVIAAQFTAAGPFRAGRAVVAKAGVYGFVDEVGKEIITPAYDALNPYAGGYARARVGDTYTFVDEQGQEFDSYYFNALDFAEGRAAVLDHRGWHYISGPTEPEKPVIFVEAYAFVEGLARVKLTNGYTFITPDYLDDPSRSTRPFGRYQLATDFADGKARVTQKGRQFFIDKDGDELE
ncbi:WG repeat-containing protein [Hymenobacter sp. H14-R3]|uniref:WG repeat-containing protein n=1 Tax=Hymenobacter sp. H14-R3 TaxID=3046308 RepID=UPI0024BA7671|nr:WG repeat-containing protein [Hymenobacter sp. H14-R3]MDJ0365156.1 WG repeat-containing protein [Hymenobacter sp. H14-R3]